MAEKFKYDSNVFMPGDLKSDEMIKHVPNPEPAGKRRSAVSQFKEGVMPIGQIQCSHPIHAIGQFVDTSAERDRGGRPTNLFECGICHAILFLVDGSGKSASDG